MRQNEKGKLLEEAERLERIAVDVEEIGVGGKFQAQKIRGTAKKIREVAIHGSGTGDD